MIGLSSGQAASPPLPPSEPRTVQGLTVDDAFLAEITRPTPWRVHSVFRRAANIVSADEVLLTIANRSSMSAPYTLVCSASQLDELGLTPASEVRWASGDLVIGNAAVISMRDVHTTSSVLTARHVDPQNLAIGVAVLEERLRERGAQGSFFQEEGDSPVDREIRRRLKQGRGTVQRSLLGGDRQAITTACRSMLGLGIGLTPSGDDYLVGVLTAHLVDRCATGQARELARAVAGAAPSATNAISAAALLAAARGRARRELSDVVHAALDGDTTRVASSLEALLNIGSTSGTDMAVGVLDALHAMLEFKEC